MAEDIRAFDVRWSETTYFYATVHCRSVGEAEGLLWDGDIDWEYISSNQQGIDESSVIIEPIDVDPLKGSGDLI